MAPSSPKATVLRSGKILGASDSVGALTRAQGCSVAKPRKRVKLNFQRATRPLQADPDNALLSLPREVRDMVYGFVFAETKFTLGTSNQLIADPFPYLVVTCRTIHEELFGKNDGRAAYWKELAWLYFDRARKWIDFMKGPQFSCWHGIKNLHLHMKDDANPTELVMISRSVDDPVMDWNRLFELDPAQFVQHSSRLFLQVEYRVRRRGRQRFIKDKQFRDRCLRRPLELCKFKWSKVSASFTDRHSLVSALDCTHFAWQLEKQIKAGVVFGTCTRDFKAEMGTTRTQAAGSLWDSSFAGSESSGGGSFWSPNDYYGELEFRPE